MECGASFGEMLDLVHNVSVLNAFCLFVISTHFSLALCMSFGTLGLDTVISIVPLNTVDLYVIFVVILSAISHFCIVTVGLQKFAFTNLVVKAYGPP